MIDEEIINEYLAMKKGLRTRTVEDYRFIINHFTKYISNNLTKDSFINYINYLNTIKKRKYRANKIKDFLEYISNLKSVDLSSYCKLLDEIKPPKIEKQLFADEYDETYTLNIEDIYTTLRQIVNMGHGGLKGVLRDVSCVVFLATTGMRVEEATWKTVRGKKLCGLTKSMIDLTKEYFILPAHLTKTHARRVIPLHKDVKLVLSKYFKFVEEEDLWNYDTVRKVISNTKLKELRRLRKFFTKKSKELGLDQVKRIAIQGHDVEELLKLKITSEFYEKYTPSEIVKEYNETWGRLEIIPEDIREFLDNI